LRFDETNVFVGENGGKKGDKNKVRLDLLPWESIIEVGKVLTFGAIKYEEDNWKKVKPKRYRSALLRHFVAVELNEEFDEETGLHHYAHMACNALFLLYFAIEELKKNAVKHKERQRKD
jgi:hypothetical protein